MQRAIPATYMRGGSSKGLFFAAEDLPPDGDMRDRVLLAVMGSPHNLQIDGLGGGHPLASKVAIIAKSDTPEADVSYLFAQVRVDKPEVSTAQNCGNMLAGVGPWAIENELVQAQDGLTPVRIHMLNSDSHVCAYVPVRGGAVVYDGDTAISGVPGTAAAIKIVFSDIAGSACGALLPTGRQKDTWQDIEVTCIDNGMPVILVRARDLDVTGCEPPSELEANTALCKKIEALRLDMAHEMTLGDVGKKSIPKIVLVSPPQHGGLIMTRSFIPHKVHESIGVFGAFSVASACFMTGSVAAGVAHVPHSDGAVEVLVEHPTGALEVGIEMRDGEVVGAALVRTARKIMAGEVFVPCNIWSQTP